MIKTEQTAIVLEPAELMELERIETDGDPQEALLFLHKVIYRKLELAQRACCGVRLEDTESRGGRLGA